MAAIRFLVSRVADAGRTINCESTGRLERRQAGMLALLGGPGGIDGQISLNFTALAVTLARSPWLLFYGRTSRDFDALREGLNGSHDC
jgi:hypothetical protein